MLASPTVGSPAVPRREYAPPDTSRRLTLDTSGVFDGISEASVPGTTASMLVASRALMERERSSPVRATPRVRLLGWSTSPRPASPRLIHSEALWQVSPLVKSTIVTPEAGSEEGEALPASERSFSLPSSLTE